MFRRCIVFTVAAAISLAVAAPAAAATPIMETQGPAAVT